MQTIFQFMIVGSQIVPVDLFHCEHRLFTLLLAQSAQPCRSSLHSPEAWEIPPEERTLLARLLHPSCSIDSRLVAEQLIGSFQVPLSDRCSRSHARQRLPMIDGLP